MAKQSLAWPVPREKTKRRLVALGQLTLRHQQMAELHWYVLRLYTGRLQMNDVEMLAEAEEILRIGKGAGPFAPIEIGDMRRPTDSGKGDMIAAQDDIAIRLAASQGEDPGRRRQGLLDQAGIQMYHQAIGIDLGAGLAKPFPSTFMQHADAKLLQDAQGSAMDLGDMILGKAPRPNQRIDQMAVIGAMASRLAGGVIAALPPATSTFTIAHGPTSIRPER
jgi:hypothetical protein